MRTADNTRVLDLSLTTGTDPLFERRDHVTFSFTVFNQANSDQSVTKGDPGRASPLHEMSVHWVPIVCSRVLLCSDAVSARVNKVQQASCCALSHCRQATGSKHSFCPNARKATVRSILPLAELTREDPESEFLDHEGNVQLILRVSTEACPRFAPAPTVRQQACIGGISRQGSQLRMPVPRFTVGQRAISKGDHLASQAKLVKTAGSYVGLCRSLPGQSSPPGLRTGT